MYLLDSVIALFTLKWRQQEPMLRPLPPHIKRTFVKTARGDLELLICEPNPASTKQSKSQPPIFFAHGGYGSAGVWLEWMTHLHNHGYPSTLYAFSVRNHGASYTLPYWTMVFGTPFEHIQSDMVDCLNAARQHEQRSNPGSTIQCPPILVGHSSGGGLAQYLLSGASKNPNLRTKASGLCLVDAIPSYGSYDMYWNWWKHDPWFVLRSVLHLQHPTSPLSTQQLVHGAFFGHKSPKSHTGAFKHWMPAFESMGWPSGMLGDNFWGWAMDGKNTWLSCQDIVKNIEKTGSGGDKVCVMIGKEDMMYRPWMWERQCDEYRHALKEGRTETEGDARDTKNEKKVVSETSEGGVRLLLVEDSGHHVQNDVFSEEAADALMRWAIQV